MPVPSQKIQSRVGKIFYTAVHEIIVHGFAISICWLYVAIAHVDISKLEGHTPWPKMGNLRSEYGKAIVSQPLKLHVNLSMNDGLRMYMDLEERADQRKLTVGARITTNM